MDMQPPSPSAVPGLRPRTGLAIACLVLGILSVFSSLLLVGALLGLLALLLGALHIAKRRGPNGMAWTGMALSVLGIGLSAGLAVLYFKGFETLRARWSGDATVASEEAVDPALAGWIGRELPEFTVTSLEGEELPSRHWRGRRVILDFWATWCPPCRREIPHFIQLSAEHSRDELLIIGISSEDEKTLQAFVDKEGIPYPVVSAHDLPAPFDAIEAIPTTFFVDRNGRIQQVVVGYHDYEKLRELALALDLPEESGAAVDNQP
ncbi:MAG: redoxin domain-containing protein [Verrucomicrobia bacterium]|jgi:peroxiredoxin|nr:redoxin domain-containing protein [Verrucomicrobiota bacterium]